jgi:hypothetical protein
MIYEKFYDMHTEMAFRNNASSGVIRAMANLGKPLNDAIAAGLMTLDTIHAPIRSACECFNHHAIYGVLNASFAGRKVPGFGSSWFRNEPDPVVEAFMVNLDTETIDLVNTYTKYVQDNWRPDLFPNAALATAAFAFQEGIDPITAMAKVINGRIDAWVSIYSDNYMDRGFN